MKRYSFKKTFVFTSVVVLTTFFLVLLIVNSTVITGYVKAFLEKGGIKEKSSATVWQDNSRIFVKFDLSQKEYGEALAFARELGTDDKWLKTLSFELDAESASKLQPLLPTTVMIDFEGKKVSFSNQYLPNLVSSGVNSKYEFATEGATLKLASNNQTKFRLEIADPLPLLAFATASGKLAASSKLEGMFPIIKKIATIELTVNGKNSTGTIELK